MTDSRDNITQSERQPARVLVLGLDGGTFDIIKPLVDQERLPNLKRLLSEGTHGTLTSTLPPITPTAWTSFYTGKNPGQHGIFDFEQAVPGTYDFKPVPANQHGHKSLWRIVSDHGRTPVVIDVPFTFPPEPINGYMITGYGTPTATEQPFTYPASLANELRRTVGTCRPAIPESLPNLTPGFFEEWDDLLNNRDRITDHLLQEVDWDFFMIVFGVIDNVEHVLWNYLEPLHADYHSREGETFREKLFCYFERVDRSIGHMLAQAGHDTYVVVMSDHGFGSVRPGLFLPNFLMEGGWLRYQANSGFSAWAMRHLLRLYHGIPLLRTMINRMATRDKERLRSAMTQANLLPSVSNIDWERTQAFATSFGVNIFINVEDRYAQGTVPPGEAYQELRADLVTQLTNLTDPAAGAPVAHKVHLQEDVYSGRLAGLGPDLIVEWTNFYRPGTWSNPGLRVPGIVGSHAMDGIFIVHGPGVQTGHTLDAHITDLAPTILHLMGLPVPPDMDGRVLVEALSPHHRAAYPPIYTDTPATLDETKAYSYSAEEEQQVMEQLRALGYVE